MDAATEKAEPEASTPTPTPSAPAKAPGASEPLSGCTCAACMPMQMVHHPAGDLSQAEKKKKKKKRYVAPQPDKHTFATQQTFLESLTPIPVESVNEANRKCPICWKPYGEAPDPGFDNSEAPVKLQCDHVFGDKCLRHTFAIAGTSTIAIRPLTFCPNSRGVLLGEKLIGYALLNKQHHQNDVEMFSNMLEESYRPEQGSTHFGDYWWPVIQQLQRGTHNMSGITLLDNAIILDRKPRKVPRTAVKEMPNLPPGYEVYLAEASSSSLEVGQNVPPSWTYAYGMMGFVPPPGFPHHHHHHHHNHVSTVPSSSFSSIPPPTAPSTAASSTAVPSTTVPPPAAPSTAVPLSVIPPPFPTTPQLPKSCPFPNAPPFPSAPPFPNASPFVTVNSPTNPVAEPPPPAPEASGPSGTWGDALGQPTHLDQLIAMKTKLKEKMGNGAGKLSEKEIQQIMVEKYALQQQALKSANDRKRLSDIQQQALDAQKQMKLDCIRTLSLELARIYSEYQSHIDPAEEHRQEAHEIQERPRFMPTSITVHESDINNTSHKVNPLDRHLSLMFGDGEDIDDDDDDNDSNSNDQNEKQLNKLTLIITRNVCTSCCTIKDDEVATLKPPETLWWQNDRKVPDDCPVCHKVLFHKDGRSFLQFSMPLPDHGVDDTEDDENM
ncbi:hypothetical protein BDW02DRAFT_651777 [Decorospora gaudefroyi]|uniref:Uncharacterized protein n=1 Tax=Decorospora gaudefroyi TaxID=184978 RepID=A0A6A5JWB9_9PLEO|nr:hypothetical protein BDW02DRAFT_651777 [Decorospora gaudefroyi]